MQIHERLFELRKRSGLTQAELAEKLNVSRQAISRWEMGTAKPDIDNLIALSELYDVSVDHLLKGGKDKVPSEEERAEPKKAERKKPSNAWLGLMLVLYIVLYAIIAVVNFDPLGAIFTAGILVAIVWGIKQLVYLVIREYNN